MWEFFRECSVDGSCVEMHSFGENTYLMITKTNQDDASDSSYSLISSVNLGSIMAVIDDSLIPAKKIGHMFVSDSIEPLNYIADLVKRTADIMGVSDIVSVYINSNDKGVFDQGTLISCSFSPNNFFDTKISINIENVYLPNHSSNELFVKKTAVSFDEMIAVFL